MRHLPILFGAAALAAALVAGPGPSSAMPAPSLKHAAEQNSAVETVGYYRWRWRRGAYPYWRYRSWGGPPPYWRYGYGGYRRPYWGWGYPYRRGWGWGGWGGWGGGHWRGGYW